MAVPTALDLELSVAVDEIIAEVGKEITFTVETAQFVEEHGERMVTSSTTYTKKTTPPAGYSQTLIDGQSIQRDDLEVGLPTRGLEFVPVVGMQASFDGVTYRVVAVNPVYSGEQVVLYMLQVRK